METMRPWVFMSGNIDDSIVWIVFSIVYKARIVLRSVPAGDACPAAQMTMKWMGRRSGWLRVKCMVGCGPSLVHSNVSGRRALFVDDGFCLSGCRVMDGLGPRDAGLQDPEAATHRSSRQYRGRISLQHGCAHSPIASRTSCEPTANSRLYFHRVHSWLSDSISTQRQWRVDI